VDVMVTAADVAADGSTQGSLSASDAFRVTVGHGNEGPGNGEDAPPPGHHSNHNDGPGASPGHPGSHDGNGHHSSDEHDHARHDERNGHKDDAHAHGKEDNNIDDLICAWFEKDNLSGHHDVFDELGREGSRGEHEAHRNAARGNATDISGQWNHMNARLKQHLTQSGNEDHFEAGASHGTPSPFGAGGHQGIPQLGKGEGMQMKAFAGLKEGLERLGC
jgi:hypothetical protein